MFLRVALAVVLLKRMLVVSLLLILSWVSLMVGALSELLAFGILVLIFSEVSLSHVSWVRLLKVLSVWVPLIILTPLLVIWLLKELVFIELIVTCLGSSL